MESAQDALLTEVLEEIFAVATGAEQIINWTPPALAEALSRIGEPLDGAKCQQTPGEERKAELGKCDSSRGQADPGLGL
jgi:hypothetical protein